jgi:hypothetical protein
MQRPLSQAALLAALLRERFGDLATIERERSVPLRVERKTTIRRDRALVLTPDGWRPAEGEWSGT